MTERLAELIEVEARNIFGGDVLGEGQRVRLMGHSFEANIVTVTCYGSDDNTLTFHPDEIVRVVREEPWLSVWPRISKSKAV